MEPNKKKTSQKATTLHSKHNDNPLYCFCRCTFKKILTSYTAWCPITRSPEWPSSACCLFRGHKCHCSRVTTSTAWPSNVTVLSMRVATGAMATWTGRLPWARLVTTVWYMLTGIWTRPAERFDTNFAFEHTVLCVKVNFVHSTSM